MAVNQQFKSKFHKHILERTAIEAARLIDEVLPAIMGSANKRTRLLSNPRIATNAEVLKIAEAMGVDPWVLIDQYELGEDGLTVLEKAQAKELYERRRAAAA